MTQSGHPPQSTHAGRAASLVSETRALSLGAGREIGCRRAQRETIYGQRGSAAPPGPSGLGRAGGSQIRRSVVGPLCVLAAIGFAACERPAERSWSYGPRVPLAIAASPAPDAPEAPKAALVAPAHARTEPAPAPASAAVLIGVDRAPGSRSLEGAVNDVVHLRDVLVASGMPQHRIALLADRAATRAAILSAIDGLAAAAPDERVVFAFAGHTRRSGGVARIVLGDGSTLPARDLARALGRVRSPMFAAFPTCYAGAFALPGIIGENRVVTFASGADELAYEWQGLSYLFRYMIVEGIQTGRSAAPTVEAAFRFAAAELTQISSRLVPILDDRYPGEFPLGSGAWIHRPDVEQPQVASADAGPPEPPPDAWTYSEPPAATPRPTPRPGGTQACGAVQIGNC